MKMKKKAGATAAKKTAVKKKPVSKPPAPKKAAGKSESPKSAPPPEEARKRTSTYTPTPVQGIGWGPFRYPPQ